MLKARLAWVLPIALLLASPLIAYEALAHTTSSVIPRWLGNFGIQFSAREWRISLRELSVTALDATLTAEGSAAPLLTAAEIVFDGNFRTFTRGLLSPGGYFQNITLRKGELHLERSAAGDWNWLQPFAAIPANRQAQALAGLAQIDGITFDAFDLVYLEHARPLPDAEAVPATVRFEGLTGRVSGLRRVPNLDERPTSVDLAARVAAGNIMAKGTAALFTPPVREQGTTESPYLDLQVIVDGLQAAALGRMVPTTRVTATEGAIKGKVTINRSPAGVTCVSDVAASGLRFAPNTRLVPDAAQRAQISADLAAFVVSAPYDACRPLSEPAAERVSSAHSMSAQIAAFNDQLTGSAPARVRELAGQDQRHLAGVASRSDAAGPSTP